jgi:DNA-binding HxlR family transcriptional regulator
MAVACEVFAERWTPIILRELLAGSHQFNEIHRGIPLISRPLLARRLRQLEAAGVITREAPLSGRSHRYCLTDSGKEFHPVIEALGAWGQRWTLRVDRHNLDPQLLMWNMRRRITLDRLPTRRVLVRLKFSGVAPRYRGPQIFWLLLEGGQAELCLEDPGFEVDLHVEANLAAMVKVWLGDVSFESVQRSREVRLVGSREMVKMFPSWLKLSHFAGVPRPLSEATES